METNAKYESYVVSVILTLFNSRKTYYRALTSLMNQTFKEYELVIVDDGSTDDIESDLFPALKINNNFKYIRHSNRKHPLSLNTGIINSTGKYITFLDSDDEYKSGHLKERTELMNSNPEIDLLHSPATIIGEEKDMFVPDAKDPSKLIHLKDCIIGGTFFGRRKVFEELHGFRNVYSHDSDFFERAKGKFNVLKFDSPSYVYFRNNPDSVINKMKKEVST